MKPTECYEVLGLKAGATLAEVRRAYKKLVLIHHPDRAAGGNGNHDRFCKITAAYAVLRAVTPRRGAQSPAVEVCPTCDDLKILYPGIDGVSRCSPCLLAQRRKRLPMPPITTARCIAPIALQIAAAGFLVHAARNGDNYGALASVGLLAASIILLTIEVLRSTVTD